MIETDAELVKRVRNVAASVVMFGGVPAPIREGLAAAVELIARLVKRVDALERGRHDG